MANLFSERWYKLRGEQKVAITTLSVCCLFLFFGGMSQLRSYVRKPFLVSHRNLSQAIQIRTQTYQDDEKQARELQLKDTDRDGISDYDEQYVYRTSPYLVDSDSDGLSDSEEIAKGEDPNCPLGKNCLDVQSAIPQTATSTFEAEAGAALAGIQANAGAQTGVDAFIMNPKPPESMTAAETRQYILQNQLLPADQLVNLSDEAILQAYKLSYQDALRIQAARTAASTGSVPAPTPAPVPSPTPSPQPTP